MKDVMVDLETFSSRSNAVIVAVGAVEIDLDAGLLGRRFYDLVDAQSCMDAGLHISGDTLMWWLQQSDAARNALNEKTRYPLGHTLKVFADWFPSGARLWGNGATFDNVVLANAYDAIGMKRPWDFRSDRCYRTLKNLHPEVPFANDGTAHNALHDAVAQANHLIAIWRDWYMVKEAA
jgi:hypothetical protein